MDHESYAKIKLTYTCMSLSRKFP